MSKNTKIITAFTIDLDLLKKVDKRRSESGISRSALINKLLKKWLNNEIKIEV